MAPEELVVLVVQRRVVPVVLAVMAARLVAPAVLVVLVVQRRVVPVVLAVMAASQSSLG